MVVWIVPGISAAGWDSLIMASLVLGLLNTFIRPVILALTLPLQVFSLGLATLALNALLFLLAAELVMGFFVAGFGSAFWGALLFSIISSVTNLFVQPAGEFRFYSRRQQGPAPKDDGVIDIEATPKENDNPRLDKTP